MTSPTGRAHPGRIAGLLSTIVDDTAERLPDRPAFRFMGAEATYAQLAERSSQLAHALRALGVRRGDRVGIFLNKGLESATAIYGILKAGAAYVPLDPAMPSDRLGFILRDCAIGHVITEPAKRSALKHVAERNHDLDPILIGLPPEEGLRFEAFGWDLLESHPVSVPGDGPRDQDMAYVMYTSGSTGEPKGIIHTHASGHSYAQYALEVYDVRPDDRLSGFPPLHFDQSTFDYFAGAIAGSCTVIIPEAYTKLPASLSKLIEDERLTIWYSVPFALTRLLLHGVLPERDLSSLRWVKFGGEPFPPKHLRELQRLLPTARFSNVYGPAEVNQCTFFHVPPLDDDQDGAIPIGRIWGNAQGLIVGDDDDPVLPGEPGELLVASPTMMSGYWNRPDLDRASLVERDRADGSRVRFYRTGDVVRARPDGELDFLGRRDRQIKSRGYRVELDEVEAVMLNFDAVAETATYAVPDSAGSVSIEAAVIPRVGQSLDHAALQSHLASHLPAYAIPDSIFVVDAFPRTSNGKIDRRALRAGSTGRAPTSGSREPAAK